MNKLARSPHNILAKARLIRLMFPTGSCDKIHNVCHQTLELYYRNRKIHGKINPKIISQEVTLAHHWNDPNHGLVCHHVSTAVHTCPSLNTINKIAFIHGKPDYYIDYHNAIYLHKGSKANSNLYIVPNAGHGVIYQYPNKVSHDIVNTYQHVRGST